MHLRSIHLGNSPSTGYMVMQFTFNYSLDQASKRYVDTFSGYTFAVAVSKMNAVLGADLLEGTMKCMLKLLRKKDGHFDPFTSMLVPVRANHKSFLDSDRFPIAVHFGLGVTQPYGEVILALIKHHHWKTTAVMNDKLTTAALSSRSFENCRAPLEQLDAERAFLQHHQILFDSYTEGFTAALKVAGEFSRDSVIFCGGNIVPL
ncbi:hypothetical protein BV898_00128 [Hypsibius exemplaris]|uniref:Uncharacterized protein n=1 Tax=Hypsibius exemplaris TaxID=2072580 RepID=A0A1W0XEU3_HYPEX|nr:hypothetical protein BV898_00128 [Hypsibius exemplaris]